MKASTAIALDIQAPPEVVFKYLSNLDYHKQWNPHLDTIDGRGQLAEGMSYETTSHVLGKELHARNTVTKLVSNNELSIENHAGILDYQINYQLSPTKAGTYMRCICTVSSSSPVFQLASPVIEMMTKDKLESDLKALRILAERPAVKN